MSAEFSPAVTGWWHATTRAGAGPDAYRVVVDPGLRDDLCLTLLDVAGGGGNVTLRADVASRLGVSHGQLIGAGELRARLDDAALTLNGADHLLYLPPSTRAELAARDAWADTRALTEADLDAFDEFRASVPETDLDEAFVELDHWLAYGTFDGARLAAVASMYPWQGSRLADLGVVTVPGSRGRGFGRRVVQAASGAAARRGYEPQYRCRLDNVASVALAESAGFRRFGRWDAVLA